MQAEIETILDRATVNSSIGGAPPGIGRPTNGWKKKKKYLRSSVYWCKIFFVADDPKTILPIFVWDYKIFFTIFFRAWI